MALRTALGDGAVPGPRRTAPGPAPRRARSRPASGGALRPVGGGLRARAPDPGPGRGTGAARLRRHRRAEGRDHMVVRAHRRAPRRDAPRPRAQGAPLLRPVRHPRLRPRADRGVSPLVSPAGGQDDGGVDPRLRLPVLGATPARRGRPRGAPARHRPRPRRALRVGAHAQQRRSPDRTSGRWWPSRWAEASTPPPCDAGARPSRPGACSCCSTSGAWPTRPGSWPGRTASWGSTTASGRPRCVTPPSPTRGPKVALEPDARRRLVELYAPDVAELAELVPELDLGLWPNFGREERLRPLVGRPRQVAGTAPARRAARSGPAR